MEKEATKSSENEAKFWPSERVPQGGLFHMPKVEYSKETSDMLKLIMKETRMSMKARRNIDYHLRTGEPLPKPKPQTINTTGNLEKNALDIMKSAQRTKRRSLQMIKGSGVYDLPNFRSKTKTNDCKSTDKEKQVLQKILANIRVTDTEFKYNAPKTDGDVTNEQLISEIVKEINERAEWLAEMEELGEGEQYRNEIKKQIIQRLVHIKKLEIKMQAQHLGYRYIE